MSLATNFQNILEVVNRKIGFKLDKNEAKELYASKAEIPNLLSSKADKKDSATKTELSNSINSLNNIYLKGNFDFYTITNNNLTSENYIRLKNNFQIIILEMEVTANINEFTDCYAFPIGLEPLEKGKYYKL